MTEHEIIVDETWAHNSDGHGRWVRVLLVRDECPDLPYNDGGSPVVRIEYRHGWTAGQIADISSYQIDPSIIRAAVRFGNDPDMLERYLRIFHGVTKVEWYETREGWSYFTCDPSHWREHVGADEGSIDMDEWRAYCEGDTYGIVVQEREEWMRVGPDSATEFRWEEAESCWGYYGHTYAEQRANEALDDYGYTVKDEDKR